MTVTELVSTVSELPHVTSWPARLPLTASDVADKLPPVSISSPEHEKLVQSINPSQVIAVAAEIWMLAEIIPAVILFAPMLEICESVMVRFAICEPVMVRLAILLPAMVALATLLPAIVALPTLLPLIVDAATFEPVIVELCRFPPEPPVRVAAATLLPVTVLPAMFPPPIVECAICA